MKVYPRMKAVYQTIRKGNWQLRREVSARNKNLRVKEQISSEEMETVCIDLTCKKSSCGQGRNRNDMP